jgi:hypothetical protein
MASASAQVLRWASDCVVNREGSIACYVMGNARRTPRYVETKLVPVAQHHDYIILQQQP